jgi:hypothetical protein
MKIITNYEKTSEGEIKVTISLESETGENTATWLFPNDDGKENKKNRIAEYHKTAEEAEQSAKTWATTIKGKVLKIKNARIPTDTIVSIKAW